MRQMGVSISVCVAKLEMAEGIDKTLLGFLTGLARRQYCGEEQFTDQFLREEVLGDMKEDGQ